MRVDTINQSISQSVSQSVNQSINQSINSYSRTQLACLAALLRPNRRLSHDHQNIATMPDTQVEQQRTICAAIVQHVASLRGMTSSYITASIASPLLGQPGRPSYDGRWLGMSHMSHTSSVLYTPQMWDVGVECCLPQRPSLVLMRWVWTPGSTWWTRWLRSVYYAHAPSHLLTHAFRIQRHRPGLQQA